MIHCFKKDLRKTPQDARSTEKFHERVSRFEEKLQKTFDCGGRFVAEKKENKPAIEFVNDQVIYWQKISTIRGHYSIHNHIYYL